MTDKTKLWLVIAELLEQLIFFQLLRVLSAVALGFVFSLLLHRWLSCLVCGLSFLELMAAGDADRV